MEHLPFLANLTYAGLFLWIFLEQAGLPIPAVPVLLAAGTFVSSGRMSMGVTLLFVIAACLAADLLWYYLGRAKGVHILHFLCRLSWKPNTCIASTKNMFQRHGAQTLLFAKFIPGLNTLAPPLAGATGVSLRRFLAFDSTGAFLWSLVPLLAGMGMWNFIPGKEVWFTLLRQHFAALFAAVVVLFLLWRYVRRVLYVRALRQEVERGVSAIQLKEMLDRGENPFILDIRHPINFGFHPVLVPGAIHIAYNEVEARLPEIPFDRNIIAYCDCPGDQAAFHAYKLLQRLGVQSIRVLKGGLDSWEKHGFPTVSSETAAV